MDKPQWQEVIAKWRGTATTVIDVELLREWSQSRVVRIKAQVNGTQLTIFAKQAHVGLDTEVAIYGLAKENRAFPAPAGTRVSIDGEEWLLLDEAQGTRLARSAPDNYQQAAKFLAEFHELASQKRWPSEANFTYNLPSRVAVLLEHVVESVRQLAGSGKITGVDLELVESVKRILTTQGPELTKRLAVFPTTLVHGDCHSGNIFVDNHGIKLVDWGSALVAPGLLDIVGLIDVAERMNEDAGDLNDVVSAYWSRLSVDTRKAYGDFKQAWRVLRVVRALLELEWFVETDGDYGSRANRELLIISNCLSRPLG